MIDQDEEQSFKKRCDNFLTQIEQLDAEIEAAALDKKRVKKLQRDKSKLQRQFAAHLGDSTVSRVYDSRGRHVAAYWRVDGVPSKDSRAEAQTWMAARGVEWNGSAPSLRGEVLKALRNKELVPEGSFGLHVEWTVNISKLEHLLIANNSGFHFVPKHN